VAVGVIAAVLARSRGPCDYLRQGERPRFGSGKGRQDGNYGGRW
jgi:hypothetical protein